MELGEPPRHRRGAATADEIEPRRVGHPAATPGVDVGARVGRVDADAALRCATFAVENHARGGGAGKDEGAKKRLKRCWAPLPSLIGLTALSCAIR